MEVGLSARSLFFDRTNPTIFLLRLKPFLTGWILGSLSFVAAAHAAPYRTELRGDLSQLTQTLPGASALYLRAAQHSRINPIEIKLKAGNKIYELSFNGVKPKTWKAFFDNGYFQTEDPTELTLFRGFATRRNTTVPVGATLTRRGAKTRLQVYFRPPNARHKSSRMLYANINLASDGTAQGLYVLRPARLPADSHCGSETGKVARSGPPYRAALGGAVKTFEVVTEADAHFFQMNGNNSNAEIATIFNQLDTVYQNDLGLDSLIIGQHVFTDVAAQPFTSPKALVMLDQFMQYRTQILPFTGYDIAHLFTGRDLKGGTIGIANVGVVCGSTEQSFGLSQWIGSAVSTAVVTMHEIGHNFGALHTGSGIMGTSLTNPPPTSFAPDSISDIMGFVASSGACLSDCVNCTPCIGCAAPTDTTAIQGVLDAISQIIAQLNTIQVPPNGSTPEVLAQYVAEIESVEAIWAPAGDVLQVFPLKPVKKAAKKVGKLLKKAKKGKKSAPKEKKIAKAIEQMDKIVGLL